MSDHPWELVTKQAAELARSGHLTFQKFTCAGCGQRLTIDEPNHFYELGTCDRCPAETNIRAQGCNYVLVTGMTVERWREITGREEG